MKMRVIKNFVKKGQRWISKAGSSEIEIISKKNNNGHWNTKKVNGSKNNHSVHEGTLFKFWENKDE